MAVTSQPVQPAQGFLPENGEPKHAGSAQGMHDRRCFAPDSPAAARAVIPDQKLRPVRVRCWLLASATASPDDVDVCMAPRAILGARGIRETVRW